MTLALVSPTSVADDCDECTLDGGKVSLCRPHDKADRAELRRLKKRTRSKDAEERGQALKELSWLSAEHANAPSEEAAQWIAAYLEEEEFALRVDAVEALLRGQHPEVVVKTLTAEVAILERDWKKADKYLVAWAEDIGKGSPSYSPKENAEFMRQLRVLQYGPPVLQALGKLPDDRSAAALVEVLGWPVESTPAPLFHAAGKSALELDTLAGANALVVLLENLDKHLANGDTQQAYGLSANSQTLGEIMVRALARPLWAADYPILTGYLSAAAQAKGLTDCPTEVLGPAGPWKAWLAEHASAFKTELGTLQKPVRATLKSD